MTIQEYNIDTPIFTELVAKWVEQDGTVPWTLSVISGIDPESEDRVAASQGAAGIMPYVEDFTTSYPGEWLDFSRPSNGEAEIDESHNLVDEFVEQSISDLHEFLAEMEREDNPVVMLPMLVVPPAKSLMKAIELAVEDPEIPDLLVLGPDWEDMPKPENEAVTLDVADSPIAKAFLAETKPVPVLPVPPEPKQL